MGIPLYSTLDEQDVSRESLLALGAGWELCGMSMPAFCPGHMVLLDALRNPYVAGGDCSEYDCAETASVLFSGRDAVNQIARWVIGGGGPWPKHVHKMGLQIAAVVSDTHEQLAAQLEYAQGGFEMVQSTHEQTGVFERYDAFWLSQVMATVQAAWPGISVDVAIWGMSMVQIGHCVAAEAKSNGATVERPVDWGKAFEKIWQTSDQN